MNTKKTTAWRVITTEKFGETLWWVDKECDAEATIKVLYVMHVNDDGQTGELCTVTKIVREGFCDNIEYAMNKINAMSDEQASGIIETLYE